VIARLIGHVAEVPGVFGLLKTHLLNADLVHRIGFRSYYPVDSQYDKCTLSVWILSCSMMLVRK
jgi:hypothetical protein